MTGLSSFRLIVPVATIALLLGACGPRDSRALACGVEAPIAREFALAHASDYRTALPRMARSPELEIDAPAYVVIYAGVVDLAITGAPRPNNAAGDPQPDGFSGVVCVVVNGSPTIYVNVDSSVSP